MYLKGIQYVHGPYHDITAIRGAFTGNWGWGYRNHSTNRHLGFGSVSLSATTHCSYTTYLQTTFSPHSHIHTGFCFHTGRICHPRRICKQKKTFMIDTILAIKSVIKSNNNIFIILQILSTFIRHSKNNMSRTIYY